MICEKCGKNNPSKNTICSNCKAPLPVTESCGGFADILTFNDVPGPVTATETRAAGMNDADAKRLVSKTAAIAEYNKKITLFTLIGAGVSTLLLILAIVFFVITSVKVSVLERKFDDFKKANDTEQVSDNDNTDKSGNPDKPENNDGSSKPDESDKPEDYKESESQETINNLVDEEKQNDEEMLEQQEGNNESKEEEGKEKEAENLTTPKNDSSDSKKPESKNDDSSKEA